MHGGREFIGQWVHSAVKEIEISVSEFESLRFSFMQYQGFLKQRRKIKGCKIKELCSIVAFKTRREEKESLCVLHELSFKTRVQGSLSWIFTYQPAYLIYIIPM